MEYVNQAGKQIPVRATADVLVVGGGPAGLSAAIASARAGAKTILAERYGCFGGNITHAGVEAIAWYRHENTVEAGGLVTEYEQRALALGGASPEPQSTSLALDAEIFKFVADDMVLESSAKPLLHCFASDAIVEDNVIKGVVFSCKTGPFAIMSKVVIDCTGDADVAFFAGANYTMNEQIAKRGGSGMTSVFNCKNVDVDRFKKFIYEEEKPTYNDWRYWSKEKENTVISEMFTPFLYKPFLKAIENKDIELEPGSRITGTYSSIFDNGEVTQMNIAHVVAKSCIDPEDLTEAEMKGRRTVLKALKALKLYCPGFENAQVRNLAMRIGTRLSRQVCGNYTLTVGDVQNEARFEDSIGIMAQFIDGAGPLVLPITGKYFAIPYRCLQSQNIDNLLVAGRAISGDGMAHGAYRQMACCAMTGQGAGAAAAVAAMDSVNVSQVSIKKTQELLRKQNVRLD